MLIRKPNRLIDEKSPYLRQHAYNPVEWYPWGAEAFFRARTEQKPVFLSIGYSSCHWCHVMERESFENPAIADLLNRYFISIKVDREERPDVDEIYISAVQLMAGHAGWPLSVFLTPDGLPFFGGTYYPPRVFADLLERIASLWQRSPEQVISASQEIKQALEQVVSAQLSALRGEPNPEVFRRYKAQLLQGYDPQYGGFGGAPKFPPNTALPLMLTFASEWDDQEIGIMALSTLAYMAHGGIFDHLGGGFHRYSTDERWFLPHFEKMLYDNAQLAYAYTYAYTLTGDLLFAEVAHRTLNWLLEEMRLPEGAFASALDADSPEGEGYYYTWTEREIYQLLGETDAPLFCEVYGVLPEGNYADEATHRPTGRNILYLREPIEAVAQRLGMAPPELETRLETMRQRLLAARRQRNAPTRDEKVLTDWNGLAIGAFAFASDALEEPHYAEVAEQCAEFLWQNLRTPEGLLLHRYCAGESAIPAYLSDYAYYCLGLLSLYETTQEERWLERAVQLTDQMIERFHDPQYGGFYSTDQHHDLLIMPVKSYQDRSLPSGNGVAVQILAKLGDWLSLIEPVRSKRYLELAWETLRSGWELAERAPVAVDSLLTGYFALEGAVMPKPDLALPEDATPEEEQAGPVQVLVQPTPEGLMVLFRIEEGWHINAPTPAEGRVPTQVEVTTDLPLQFGEPVWMPPTRHRIGEEELEVYLAEAGVLVPVIGVTEGELGEGYVRVRVVYQPCTETECALPVERQFLLPLRLQEE